MCDRPKDRDRTRFDTRCQRALGDERLDLAKAQPMRMDVRVVTMIVRMMVMMRVPMGM